LVDYRQDGARDELKILAQMDWNHRLNVDYRLRLIVGADIEIEIEIVLNQYADQVGDRVLRLLGQLAFKCFPGRPEFRKACPPGQDIRMKQSMPTRTAKLTGFVL